MSADDPGPHRRLPPADPTVRPGGPRGGQRASPPVTAPTLLERPDGSWQVGVGPGAVVLRTSGRGSGTDAGRALGPALAGLTAPAPHGHDAATRESPVCPVLGTGALAARLRRALGEVSPEEVGPVQVVVHQHVVPPDVGMAVARAGRATVPVVAQFRRVLVGPVVGVGAGPCLHCLDLHRRDRDGAWPTLATALGHPAEQATPLPVPEPLVRACEGLVLLLAASVIAGATLSVGLGYELGPGAPHVVVRRWTRHPRCPLHP